MKKNLLALAVLLLGVMAQGQTFLYQDFGSGYWPPPGWASFPLGSQWKISPTDRAGGHLPEGRFDGFDYIGTVRLVSPLVDLTGIDTVILSFRYFSITDSIYVPSMGISTRSGNGNWQDAWETTLQNSKEPRFFEVLITNSDVNHSNFQFSFFLEGDFNRIRYFFLDDIRLYHPNTADGKLDQILTPMSVDQPVPVAASVKNLGNTTISEVKVSWLSYMGIKHDSIFTDLDLGIFDTFAFQFNRWWVSDFGNHDLKMWISSVNGAEDPNHVNDTLTRSIFYGIENPRRRPCFEEFNNSNSFDCGLFDSRFVPWCENHPYETVIDYPTNANGYIDPYFIEDIEQRRLFYEVEYLPRTFCNGTLAADIDSNDIQVAYDSALQLVSNFRILSSFHIVTDTIFVQTNIFPLETYTGTKIYNIVLEKTTTGNTGQNGRTEFYNVVMKIFPDGDGQEKDFVGKIPVNLAYSIDLDSTFVEDSTDLTVAVFIQKQDSTKEILQSAYAVENAVFSPENRLSMIRLDGVPVEGFDPDIYTYDVELPSNAAESPVVTGTTMDAGAWTIIDQAFELPGYAIIDVYPEDLSQIKRYIISFSLIEGVADNQYPAAVSVFPNPSDGKLFISGAENAHAMLFSLDGKLILDIERIQGRIDISGVRKGVYILYLSGDKGIPEVKKIVVL